MNRHLLFLIAAAGSIGVPLMTSSSGLDGMFQKSESIEPNSNALLTEPVPTAGLGPQPIMQGTPTPQLTGGSTVPPPRRVLASSTLTGPEAVSFTELFRFDITADWVRQHWSRVSTVTEQPTLQGYRVPVVTGTQPFDLAGSLTYYFNSQRQLQRIVFHGNTGDVRPLTQWITGQHQLRAQDTEQPGLQLYQRFWHGRPVSELRILPTSVMQQSNPQSGYEVHLLLERPADETIFKAPPGTSPSWRL